MFTQFSPRRCLALLTLLTAALSPRLSHACGGLFCSQSSPVNQAAERIIFAQKENTTTAIIEIQYDGPSESFSWVLPVPGIPEVGLSSTQALDQLQTLTNPIYQLNTVREECKDFTLALVGSSDANAVAETAAVVPWLEPVSVVNAGNVGPYDYEVLKVDNTGGDVTRAVLDWLAQNGYDVTSLGEDLLRDYLSQGLNLLAFRLSKTAQVGSVRPILIRYEASKPVIPIRPTAVAANPDMGVMVWVLGEHRAVPENYLSLELNEMLIDWFNPNDSYNSVVTRAAHDAGGQGFVTEMSDSTKLLEGSVYQDGDYVEQLRIMLASPDAYQQARVNVPFDNWDGFADVISRNVPVPEDMTQDEVVDCMSCALSEMQAINQGEVKAALPPAAEFTIDTRSCDEIELAPGAECAPVMGSDGRPLWDPERFLEEFQRLVLDPLQETQAVFDEHKTFTRFYTTMSPEDMTVDPAFDFNPDLDAVSNLHTKDRHVGCNDNWEVFFPDGRVSNDEFTWPVTSKDMPANRRVLQLGLAGEGMVLEDNSEAIHKSASKLKQFDVTNDNCSCRTVGSRPWSGWAVLPLLASALAMTRLRRRRFKGPSSCYSRGCCSTCR